MTLAKHGKNITSQRKLAKKKTKLILTVKDLFFHTSFDLGSFNLHIFEISDGNRLLILKLTTV